MRFARVLSAHDQPDPAIDALVVAAELDVLQLDYQGPDCWPLDANRRPLRSRGHAAAFLQQLCGLHKTLYLDPRLHVVTNAGGGNTIDCVELLGQFLCEHGDSELLMTAVRGDNVLPRIEELLAEGLELNNRSTGAPLVDLQRPILAAQIQLGAGPFATALDEGSRIVVAGCYDPAAPLIAAGVHHFRWNWDRFDALAGAAVAAQLGGWPKVLELHNDGSATLETSSEGKPFSFAGNLLQHADVCCETAALQFEPTDYGPWRVTGASGSRPSGQWPLALIYAAGYRSTVLFELIGPEADELAGPTIEALHTLLDREKEQQRITIRRLQTVDGQTGEGSAQSNYKSVYVHVCCSSQQRAPGEEFVRAIANFSVRRRNTGLRVSGPWPEVQLQTARWWTEVPREAITVSVDTRPAQHWL